MGCLEWRDKYNEISEFFHKYEEPVYITRNGQGELAVMSIETYEKLVGKFELNQLLDEGMKAMNENSNNDNDADLSITRDNTKRRKPRQGKASETLDNQR